MAQMFDRNELRRAALLLCCLVAVHVGADEGAKGKEPMQKTAAGEFEVTLKPHEASAQGQEATLGRMSIDKQFRGQLEGTSVGEMLMVRTAVDGSAGYVALERVNATLDGHRGTFLLQHSGIMDRGAAQLMISVVPDSGTGELAGLHGSMSIDIREGKHFYRFDYSLPGTQE